MRSVKTGVLSIPKWFKKEVDLPEALTGWKRPGGRPEEEESVKTKGLKQETCSVPCTWSTDND